MRAIMVAVEPMVAVNTLMGKVKTLVFSSSKENKALPKPPVKVYLYCKEPSYDDPNRAYYKRGKLIATTTPDEKKEEFNGHICGYITASWGERDELSGGLWYELKDPVLYDSPVSIGKFWYECPNNVRNCNKCQYGFSLDSKGRAWSCLGILNGPPGIWCSVQDLEEFYGEEPVTNKKK